ASLMAPIANGIRKPARLPIELIIAMPAAAAAPPRMEVGVLHDTGRADMMPIVHRVRPVMAAVTLPLAVTLITRPIDPTGHMMAVCQRGSRRRSALRAMRYIATMPKDHGIALIRPTSSGSLTPIALMIVGSQNDTPYRPEAMPK